MTTFYDTYNLSIDKKIELCKLAYDLSYNWWVDILDTDKSLARKKINLSFNRMMGYLSEECHFTIVHRHSDVEDYIEVGFRTMTHPCYFLWIEVAPEHAEKITQGLKKL